MAEQLEKLSVKPGDVIVVHEGIGGVRSEDDAKLVKSLAENLGKAGIADVLVVLLPHGASMRSLDEKGMREAGWVPA